MSLPTKDIRVRNWVTKNIPIGTTFQTCGKLSKDLNLTPTQIGKILVRTEGEMVEVMKPNGGSYTYRRLV